MKFCNLKDKSKVSDADLSAEYKSSHSYGVTVVGDKHLFVKKGISVYFIAYEDAERIFRRVRKVNAMMCCENGELEIEYLVINSGGEEVMEVQLPGAKAARMLMDEIKTVAPDTEWKAS